MIMYILRKMQYVLYNTVLLSVVIVEELELIWGCGWRVDLFLFSCGC
jgi:hypothetical protein